ncbi:DUF2207 domain-containing protein [Facklamia sp. 7083-14-GEN3]|uniref:DUF2207 domain-containing protein n=1 Tax=Facklamia sp. 7083-14-GEN3 TaxID=2973478 RepID=UPI00215C07AD|nr:DUF2207 domain-containing protein [Facklamia sp. 7083-14-GEN3]MCR8969558.1 DUF2207 domain-containing protein [Facklamia sp. 7083-14-GEN3]
MIKYRIQKVLAFVVTFLCVLAGSLTPVIAAQEVNFSITDQFINAKVMEDGSVEFTDYQYYDADFMNGVLFELDHEGYQLSNFSVGISENKEGSIKPLNLANTENRGTYQTQEENGILKSKIFYPLENEGKYFVFQYTLEQLVTNYQDTAELLRQFGRSNYTTDVQIRIELPQKAESKEEVRAWGYGAPQGEVRIVEEDQKTVVYLDVPQRKASQFVEGQIVFPTDWTSLNLNKVDEKRLDQILKAAQGQVEKDAKNVDQMKMIAYTMAILGSVAPPLLLFFSLMKYRRQSERLNPQPVYVPDYFYDLPEKTTPGQMATKYLREWPNEDDFVATLLHLVQKGWLKIEAQPGRKQSAETVMITPLHWGTDYPEGILEHEKFVWDYFTQANEGAGVTLAQLDQLAEDNPSFRKKQYRYWLRFKNKLAAEGEKFLGQALVETRKIEVTNNTALILMIAGIIINLLFLYSLDITRLLPMNIIGMIIGIGSVLSIGLYIYMRIVMKKHPLMTTEQQEMRDKWQAFRKMLKDIGRFNVRKIASLPLWEEYLVFATSLGVADRVVKAIELEFKPSEIQAQGQRHYPLAHPYLYGSLFRNQVTQSIQSVSPQSTGQGGFAGNNKGGFGGGFSGGSMGGSGGGTFSGGF